MDVPDQRSEQTWRSRGPFAVLLGTAAIAEFGMAIVREYPYVVVFYGVAGTLHAILLVAVLGTGGAKRAPRTYKSLFFAAWSVALLFGYATILTTSPHQHVNKLDALHGLIAWVFVTGIAIAPWMERHLKTPKRS